MMCILDNEKILNNENMELFSGILWKIMLNWELARIPEILIYVLFCSEQNWT